jgi:hypothetical protein
MSFPLDLDEIPDLQLQAEIVRRAMLGAKGRCTYCGRLPTEPVCKLPIRHRAPSERRLTIPISDEAYTLVFDAVNTHDAGTREGTEEGQTQNKDAVVRAAQALVYEAGLPLQKRPTA